MDTRANVDLEVIADKLVTLMGSTQPTLQSFTEHRGHAATHYMVDGKDWRGDGTVYTGAS